MENKEMTIQPLPKSMSRWRHTNGNAYVVLALANTRSTDHSRYPVYVVYAGLSFSGLWVRRADDWHRSMTQYYTPPAGAEASFSELAKLELDLSELTLNLPEGEGLEPFHNSLSMVFGELERLRTVIDEHSDVIKTDTKARAYNFVKVTEDPSILPHCCVCGAKMVMYEVRVGEGASKVVCCETSTEILGQEEVVCPMYFPPAELYGATRREAVKKMNAYLTKFSSLQLERVSANKEQG